MLCQHWEPQTDRRVSRRVAFNINQHIRYGFTSSLEPLRNGGQSCIGLTRCESVMMKYEIKRSKSGVKQGQRCT